MTPTFTRTIEPAKTYAQFIRRFGEVRRFGEGKETVSERFSSIEALAPLFKRERELAAQNKLCRLEAVQITEITSRDYPCSRAWADFSAYQPPLANAAVTLELGVKILGDRSGPSAVWRDVVCESHEERLLLAEYLRDKGRIEWSEFSKTYFWSVVDMRLVDRHILWDNEHIVNRHKLGNPTLDDRNLNEKVKQHVLPQVWAGVTVLGSMDLQKIVDQLLKSCPGCSEALLWRAVNALFELHAQNLDKGGYPITLKHLEAMAAALAGPETLPRTQPMRIADAIELAIDAYPDDLRAPAMQIVKQVLGITA